MKIGIRAIGKIPSPDPEQRMIETYMQRLRPLGAALGLAFELHVFPASASASNEALRREADYLWPKSLIRNKDGAVFLLDERGKQLPSLLWAQLLDYCRTDRIESRGSFTSGNSAALRGIMSAFAAPVGSVHFLVGGASGVDASLHRRVHGVLGYGNQTWPHRLIRVMLCEQLYRACSILAGHPYHRA